MSVVCRLPWLGLRAQKETTSMGSGMKRRWDGGQAKTSTTAQSREYRDLEDH